LTAWLAVAGEQGTERVFKTLVGTDMWGATLAWQRLSALLHFPSPTLDALLPSLAGTPLERYATS